MLDLGHRLRAAECDQPVDLVQGRQRVAAQEVAVVEPGGRQRRRGGAQEQELRWWRHASFAPRVLAPTVDARSHPLLGEPADRGGGLASCSQAGRGLVRGGAEVHVLARGGRRLSESRAATA